MRSQIEDGKTSETKKFHVCQKNSPYAGCELGSNIFLQLAFNRP
jgi:hypothetical protein